MNLIKKCLNLYCKLIILNILFSLPTIVKASEFPIDTTIIKGTFDNGLTYYIKENSTPEKKVQLRLLVKAGSMMEEDHQKGLAHLLEHVAFNGSKNFPKNSIDQYFNSIGLNLGSHFNAFTWFNKTTYDIEIPTDVDGALDKGLLFLSDIIKNLELTDESFEKERKIVEEEVLSDLTSGIKYQDLFLTKLLEGSNYPNRLPRGDLEVIRNFKYQDVIDFYEYWYQPENIAIFIVGDIESEKVLKILKRYFSTISNQKINKEINFIVPNYTEDKFLKYQDDKEDQISFSIFKKSQLKKLNTRENYRNDILKNLTYDIFQKRLDEIYQSEKPDFLSSLIGSFTFTNEDEFEYFNIELNQENIENGIVRLYEEVEKVLRFGFNDFELKEAKDRYLILSEDNLLEAKTTASDDYVDELERNFLQEEMISGSQFELELIKELLPGILLDEVNNYFFNIFEQDNRFIEIKSPENIENLPELDRIKQLQLIAKKKNITPYESRKLVKLEINDELDGSKISKRVKIPKTGIQKIILDNGIIVYLKPTNFEQNVVYFSSSSIGGYSLASDETLPSAKSTQEILELANIGNLRKVDLRKLYPRKSLNVYPSISAFQEGLQGWSTNQFLEEMFMLIYKNFYHLEFDEQLIKNYKQEKINQYINFSQDPQFEFNKNFYEKFNNNHPRVLYPDEDYFNKINLKDVKFFYEDRFKDAKDFVFVFVGDFKISKIEPLIEKYLGSLKITNREETFVDHKIRFNQGYELFLYEEEDPLNLNHVRYYNGYFKNSLKNRFKLYFIEEILDQLLMDKIREEKNLVYSITAIANDTNKFPEETYSFIIDYSTSLKNENDVNKEIQKIINQLINNDYENIQFENAKKKLLYDHEDNLKTNSYWLSLIPQYHQYGESISRVNYIDTIINSITRNDLSKLSKHIFSDKYLNIIEKLAQK